MVSQKPKYCKNFERNSHQRKLSMIMVWERYCNASPKPEFFLFSLFIFSFISQLIWVRLGLKFSQMILHTETSKLMYNWSYLFVVLHKPTLLPSTFNITWETLYLESLMNLDNILTTLEVENKTKNAYLTQVFYSNSSTTKIQSLSIWLHQQTKNNEK